MFRLRTLDGRDRCKSLQFVKERKQLSERIRRLQPLKNGIRGKRAGIDVKSETWATDDRRTAGLSRRYVSAGLGKTPFQLPTPPNVLCDEFGLFHRSMRREYQNRAPRLQQRRLTLD